MYLLDKNLIQNFIPSEAIEVCKIIKEHGYKCYIVGGFIRDIILKRNIGVKLEHIDIDIATSAYPEDILNMFEKVIPTGLKHGTVTVLFKNIDFEITTFRIESNYFDNRHPEDIKYIDNIYEDLSRRDFTINSIAYDPLENVFIDPYNGYDDLIKNIVRTVGDPEKRFEEDALRIIRAIRFATTLNFEIEEKTFEAIKKYKNSLLNISKERIRDEFNKILLSAKPSFGIDMLRRTGILSMILPELEECIGIEQNVFHKYDIYWHSLYTCDAAQNDINLKLAALLHDVGKLKSLYYFKGQGIDGNVFYDHEKYSEEIARNFMIKYRYSNQQINIVTRLIRYHMFHYTKEWTDGAVRRFIKRVGLDLIAPLFSLRVADRIGNGKSESYPQILIEFYEKIKRVIEEDSALKVTDLEIDGNDIKRELKIPPSRKIGEILNYLLDIVIEDPTKNNYEFLIQKAKEYYSKDNQRIQENSLNKL
ncbi:MAG: HD domain-containing protein [Spirochaetes bacterium]|nr:HD domain-containing protein [Spirochaetota bacterium]